MWVALARFSLVAPLAELVSIFNWESNEVESLPHQHGLRVKALGSVYNGIDNTFREADDGL